MSQPIPRQLDDVVRRELEPNEKVLWMEQPIPKYFTQDSTAFFIIGILVTAFSIFWTWSAAGYKIPDFSDAERSIFALFGVPFALVGLGMLSSPLWAHRKAGRSVYVLTDRRAITFDDGWMMTIRSYPPQRLQSVFRHEKKDGTGNVVLEQKELRDTEGGRITKELGFVNIRNPRMVEQMLKTLAKQESTKQ